MVSVTPAVVVITMSDGEEKQKRRHCTFMCPTYLVPTVCLAIVYQIVYTTYQWNDTTYHEIYGPVRPDMTLLPSGPKSITARANGQGAPAMVSHR